jgi:UDP-3-O-[3-hydroxymyristoyl] glucosamine N-acyltransferase
MPESPLPLRLAQIAELVQGEIKGDDQISIDGVAPFDQAGHTDIAMAAEAKYMNRIDASQAGALIVPDTCPATAGNLLLVKNPRAAFAKVMAHFHPMPLPQDRISNNVRMGQHGSMGKQVEIGDFVSIGHHVNLGDRVILGPGVVVGDHVSIGDDTRVAANVVIKAHCRLGRRVLIQAGTIIGSDGFGFAQEDGRHLKIPQTGNVIIGDDVEIGANNTIDRGTFGSTRIGNGVKTDNLVHVAHNVVVGDHTLLIAQVGIAGSVTIGKNTIIAGQVGVAPHVTIGDYVMVGPQSGVGKSIADKQVFTGSPAMPHRLFLKVSQILQSLPDLRKRILRLEKKLRESSAQNGE